MRAEVSTCAHSLLVALGRRQVEGVLLCGAGNARTWPRAAPRGDVSASRCAARRLVVVIGQHRLRRRLGKELLCRLLLLGENERIARVPPGRREDARRQVDVGWVALAVLLDASSPCRATCSTAAAAAQQSAPAASRGCSP